MRTIHCILAPFLFAVVACNSPTTGDQGQLEFTPVNCGNPLLGCAFSAGLALGSTTDVEVRATDGRSLDGVMLGGTSTVMVGPRRDLDGVPTWSVTAVGGGGVTLSATDASGAELDSTSFTIYVPQRLGLAKIAGEATGPATEAGVDEAWTVPAGQLVSFQVVPFNGEYRMIGRLAFEIAYPVGSPLPATEQSTSDPDTGYLYVQPPAGDHAFSFLQVGDDLTLDVMLHAQ